MEPNLVKDIFSGTHLYKKMFGTVLFIYLKADPNVIFGRPKFMESGSAKSSLISNSKFVRGLVLVIVATKRYVSPKDKNFKCLQHKEGMKIINN